MQAAAGDTAIQESAQYDRASVLEAIFSREGVLDPVAGQLRVTQRGAGANYSVDVAVGKAAIRGDDISDQGTYTVLQTTVVNLAVPTSGSSSRTHQVVLRLRDKLSNSAWTTYDAVFQVLADTSLAAALALPSTIVLATLTVPANATSVTTAMVSDRRPFASVGTPDRTGTYQMIGGTANYNPTDGTRPLRWAVNPDGWVSLSGWCRRVAGTTNLASGTQYQITEVLDAAILPSPATYRDFTGVTSEGFVQYAVMPGGFLSARFFAAVTFTQNASWLSFDGCGYRL